MRYPLFDIDLTLIKGDNSAHIKAFDYALANVFNLPKATVTDMVLHGMIDGEILIKTAQNNWCLHLLLTVVFDIN